MKFAVREQEHSNPWHTNRTAEHRTVSTHTTFDEAYAALTALDAKDKGYSCVRFIIITAK